METQEYSVLSVMGPHAGEDSDVIFARKIADIRKAGRTFWVIRSHKAKPDMIQTIGSAVRTRSGALLCAFLAPSAPGGAIPTKTSSAANYIISGDEDLLILGRFKETRIVTPRRYWEEFRKRRQ